MLNSFCSKILQNKNILMLVSASIYIFSLFAILSDNLLVISLVVSVLFIFLIIKNLFPLKYVIIWALLFYLGVVNTLFRTKDVGELINLAPLNSEISGVVVSIPQVSTDGKIKFFFDVDKIIFGGVKKDIKNEKVLVTLSLENMSVKPKIYDSISLNGRLSLPFKAGNPSQFDYGNYLRNHSTYAVFYAKNLNFNNREPSLRKKFLQKIGDYRENILAIHSKYLPSPNLEILGGIVFGDDAVPPPKNIKNSFANSGLLHILAASGMNVAFIYSFFFLIFSRLKINYKVSVILGMLMMIIYSFMTGLGASIVRATTMLMFVLIGKLIDRDANSISLLFFVALLMLVYNPLYIMDVGFQLSFIVTFGILLMAPSILKTENKFKNYIIDTVAISVIAQLWVVPIQIFYFNNISVYSILANVMSVTILAILSFGGFLSSLIAGIKPLADFVCQAFDYVLNPLLTILVNISDFWGHLPNSNIQTTHPSVFQIFLFYGILFCITGLLYKDFREKYFKPLLITILSLSVIWIISIIPIKNNNLEVISFDVGNADCFLIKSPKNEYIMIDTGKATYKGGKSQAEIIVLKYLKDRGIKNFDSVIVTHFDNDHCGGAVDILKNLKVKTLFVNDLNHTSYSAKSIYKTASQVGTKIVLAKNKQVVYDKNGLKLTNLLCMSADNDNENSIITLLEYQGYSILFTGDASALGLSSILGSVNKNITVLKVPHHGAVDGLNKKLVDYLNPKYSIISVGENKFGHPSILTLTLLKNSKILRTDIDNSILIKIYNQKLKIYSYDINSRKYIYINE